MKKLLTILFFLASLSVIGQTETHDFITYDTVYHYFFNPFEEADAYIRISRPRTLFTSGSTDTAARPAIITMPGVGEMGSDTTNLYKYGPHSWLMNGWDGSVVLGNGTHYPILVTIIWNVSPPDPPLAGCIEISNYLIKYYHINPKAVHFGGLSEGAFTWSSMLQVTDTTGTNSTGPDVGMKFATSVTLLSGAATNGSGSTAWIYAGRWASVYHGKAFLTVGFADAQTPNPPLFAQNMNDSAANSAYFTYNTIGSGSHCCWNTAYDPNLHLWNSGVSPNTPAGTYVTTSTDPNTQGSYISGSSIFQWMLRQGDTTLVGQPGTTKTAKAFACGEYVFGEHASNDTLYWLSPDSTHWTALPLPSGQLLATEAVGFNNFRLISKTGNYYKSTNYNVTPATLTQTPLDTTGAGFTNCLAVWTFIEAAVVQRADSSLWLTDNDTLFILPGHTSGVYVITKPIKISQAGVKYIHVSMGADGIYGTTSDGKIYQWVSNSHTLTPTLVWAGTPVRAMMTATANPNVIVAIMRNLTGDTTCGRIYAKGTSWGDWGGTSVTYSAFTDITTSILGLPRSVRSMVMNSNSFHMIDSLGLLWGVAKCNSQGELGNGVEFVNRYTYPTYNGIGWTFTNTENPAPGPAVLVGGSTVFTHIYGNPFFTFYTFGIDNVGNAYFCGREKTIAADGYQQNLTDNENHPNALDHTKYTLVNPLTETFTQLDFTAPSASAGSNQSIGVPTATVTASGIPVTLTLHSNSADTIKQRIVAYAWTKTSGSGTITSPTSKTTTITGLTSGVSHFQVLETDDNGGQDTAGLNITVSMTAPTVSAGSNQTIGTTSTMVFGTCTANGGATMATATWAVLSVPAGAAAPTIFASGTATAPVLQLSGLVPGVYTVKLTGTDSNSNSANSTITITVTSSLTPNRVTLPVRVLFH